MMTIEDDAWPPKGGPNPTPRWVNHLSESFVKWQGQNPGLMII